MKNSHIILAFGMILLLSCLTLSQDPQDPAPSQRVIKIDQLVKINDVPTGDSYYYVNFQYKQSDGNLFIITVQTDLQDTIGIYTSMYYDGINTTYYQYPNWENNSMSCVYTTMDSCVVNLPELGEGQTKNITIYFGVEVFFTSSMTILTQIQYMYSAKVGYQYTVNFTKAQAAVLTLSASDVNKYEQVVIRMEYDIFQTIGKFALYAGVNKVPTNFQHRIQSQYMGAFNQLMILQPLQDEASQYFIIIEGQQGTVFDLFIEPFSKSAPKLEMNKTVFYMSKSNFNDGQQTTFSMMINYLEQNDTQPLFVNLNSLAGYGEFQVDYCDGLTNFKFININGQAGEIIIPVEQRKQCYDQIKKQGALTIQNLDVTIKNVAWHFSYSIGVFQGNYPLSIGPYSQKLGTLLQSQQSRVYSIQNYINQSFILKYKTISGQKQLNFTLYQCKNSLLNKNKCTKLLNSIDNQTIDQLTPEYMLFKFTCSQKKYYKLQISHNSNSNQTLDSEYVLLLLPLKEHSTVLMPAKPITQMIEQNQYQFYVVNLTLIQKQFNITIDNLTNIFVTMTQTNGDCMLFSSLVEKEPKYDMIFAQNSTVDYSWTGKKQFNLNSQENQAIYLSVLGASQSIYQIQLTIEISQDVPQKYTRLVSDKLLSFSLSSDDNQDHILLSYTAHSIPYTIIISPTPSCIIYSYSLPITNKTCRELPYSLTQKVIYMKIYRNLSPDNSSSSKDQDKDFKFSVFVYSGMYYLFEYSPVMIACVDVCYEYVRVYVPEKIMIVHRGMGNIAFLNSSQTYSNQKMEITCEKGYPCFHTINASLPWGGDMELFYDSADIQQIQWLTKPLTFQSAWDPKRFYMPIRSWNQINTAIFYTQGVSLQIYYNIYTMRQNATNALQYGFPNPYTFMKRSSGNPLRRFHIVEFDKALIQQLGCSESNQLCIATLTVYPNSNVDYSTGYVKNSIGYFSSNTFEYWIPVNSPYELSQQYSLLYFRHELSQDQISNLPPYYYVKVQPLSNCRPQIFAPSPYVNPDNKNNTIVDTSMPYYGTYKINSKELALDSSNHNINFSISTDTPCEYMVWLLDNDVQPIIENVNYQLTSDENGFFVVVFSDKYLWNNRQFVINVDQTVNQIAINTYQKYSNGSIKLPSSSNNVAYAVQTRQLKFDSKKQGEYSTHLYTIKISTSVNKKINLKISTYQYQTIILTNQITKFSFSEQNKQISYRYYSNNDFMMFVTTDMGSVKLTVTDWKRDGDRNVVEMYLDENSPPWIKVKAVRGDIRQYVIKLEQVLLSNNAGRNLQGTTRYPKISLHIQESGTIGLPQLYDGIALFDSFYQEDAQNCYKYISGQILGRPSLTIDIIFGSDFINKLPTVAPRLTLESGGKLNSTWTKLPTGFRMATQFYADQVYQMCYSINDAPELVSKQFYVMVENTEYSLRHLTLDVPMSSHSPDLYEIYQYVATQSQNVMIQVVNCFGKPTLLGAKQYSDIYNGQISQLGSFYRDDTKSIAMKKLDLGYFYFGIRSDTNDDKYKIRVQLLQPNQTLHYDKFELKQKLITKLKTYDNNGQTKLRVNIPKINVNNLPNEVRLHHITYNLFVDNLKDQQQYSSNVIAKCPALGNRNMSSYKVTKQFLGGVKVGEQSNDQNFIEIPISQVPQLFNLTGYAQISISQPYTQTLTYYYESSTFKLRSIHEGKGLGVFTVIFIVAMCIGSLVIAYLIYRRWKERKQKAKIAFEMATYNHNENYDPNNTAANNQKMEENFSPNTSPGKSLRKALNENVGYGEFIDQNV